MSKRTSEKAAALLLGLSVFAISSGAASAFLTAYPQELQNVISMGSVDVRVTEENWKPETAENLLPGEVISKNPVAANTGKSDAWIFLHVTVPVKMIRVVDEATGEAAAAAPVELFSFTAAPEWTLIGRTPGDISVEYVYGYPQIVAGGEKTSALFEEVCLVNYLEGELAKEELLLLPVEAVSVQHDLCAPGTSLAEIYRQYLAQTQEII